VVSDEGDACICSQYGVWHIVQQNYPVTSKFNTAMKYMQSIGVDAVMIIGSDDVISTNFYRKTLEQVEKGVDLIGVQNAYFFCGQGLDRGKLVKLEGRNILGIGKTVSKRILDLADWTLWRNDKNWGMDAMAQQEIDKYNPTKVIIDEIIVDVKTKDNLNSFNVFKRRPQMDNSIFFNILSEEEKEILRTL
jgi:ribosomal protein S13